MDAVTDRAIAADEVGADVVRRCKERARKALSALKRNNPKAHAMVLDPAPHIAGRCPRRAGKTYTVVTAALCMGESKPNAITIIISLNLKQLKRLYWEGPAGINTLARKYGIKLTTNGNDLSWKHENGSMGYLLGCDDDEQLEVIRGLEADLYVVDECKSFAPAKLRKLIVDIIDPQRKSRMGRLMLIGTPGHILEGPFYEATCVRSTKVGADGVRRPYCLPYGEVDPWGRKPYEDRLWSLHTWTLQDNKAMYHQWEEALLDKAAYEWPDDHPSWLRESLGEWTTSSDGLVFRYGAEKSSGRVTWVPAATDENPTGLPKEGAPWRLIGGLDIGYEAPTAFVVCAYSSRLCQLRHVWDYSGQHLLVHDIAAVIQGAQERFGPIEKIYADKGNLGKLIVETLVQQYGFPIEAADKREKFDHIELLNGAFARGELKIIEGTTLESQLLTNAWDLEDGTRQELGRLGRLKEDVNIPNDSTDALIYLYRGSLHHFRVPEKAAPPKEGTPEWKLARFKAELAAARRVALEETSARSGLGVRLPRVVAGALGRNAWKSPALKRLLS